MLASQVAADPIVHVRTHMEFERGRMGWGVMSGLTKSCQAAFSVAATHRMGFLRSLSLREKGTDVADAVKPVEHRFLF